jgi:hypothetical protein
MEVPFEYGPIFTKFKGNSGGFWIILAVASSHIQPLALVVGVWGR